MILQFICKAVIYENVLWFGVIGLHAVGKFPVIKVAPLGDVHKIDSKGMTSLEVSAEVGLDDGICGHLAAEGVIAAVGIFDLELNGKPSDSLASGLYINVRH